MIESVLPDAIYLLCATTSVICTGLLVRAYFRTKTQLLYWASICFAFLALNNVLLFIDLSMVPTIDLRFLRATSNFLGVMTMIYGLIRETV